MLPVPVADRVATSEESPYRSAASFTPPLLLPRKRTAPSGPSSREAGAGGDAGPSCAIHFPYRVELSALLYIENSPAPRRLWRDAVHDRRCRCEKTEQSAERVRPRITSA